MQVVVVVVVIMEDRNAQVPLVFGAVCFAQPNGQVERLDRERVCGKYTRRNPHRDIPPLSTSFEEQGSNDTKHP